MMQRLNLAALLTLGTLWAGLLVVGGLALVAQAGASDDALAAPTFAGGLTAIVAGQFVFLSVVADRVVPHAPRPFVASAECLLGAAFLAGAVWTATTLTLGATP